MMTISVTKVEANSVRSKLTAPPRHVPGRRSSICLEHRRAPWCSRRAGSLARTVVVARPGDEQAEPLGERRRAWRTPPGVWSRWCTSSPASPAAASSSTTASPTARPPRCATRVGDDRHSPGRAHQLDRPHRVGRVVGDVVGAVVAEAAPRTPRRGGATTAGGHQRVGDVRPPRRGAVPHLGAHRLHRDGDAVGRHQRDHPVEPGVAAVPRASQLRDQVGVRRGRGGRPAGGCSVPPAARHLDAAHQPDAVCRAPRRPPPPSPSVVSWSVSATVVSPASTARCTTTPAAPRCRRWPSSGCAGRSPRAPA